jgi:hypothetical protein
MIEIEMHPTSKQLLKAMEVSLSDLAALWRGNKNTPQADQIVRHYHAILRCMIELGHREPLDVDAELPKRLLPAEYLNLFKSA